MATDKEQNQDQQQDHPFGEFIFITMLLTYQILSAYIRVQSLFFV